MTVLLNAIVQVGFALLVLSLLFIPMERVFPAKKGQKVFRKFWLVDFSFLAGNYMFWNGLVIVGLSYFQLGLDGMTPVSFRLWIFNQPYWLQVLEVILISDFLIYWGHRLQHKVDFLWRFHKVHHSAEKLDWLAAHREHPLDSIYTVGIINLPAMLLGFPLESIAIVVAFRGIWAVFIHSNVRLPLGPFKVLIGSPELHHWHHDLERDRGNYANLSPLMDVIFGTYTCPDHEPEAFGIKETFSTNYVGQLTEPFLPKKKQEVLRKKLETVVGQFKKPKPDLDEVN